MLIAGSAFAALPQQCRDDVWASPVAVNGTASDGVSGVATVTVNASAASGTTIWTRTGVVIGTGGTSLAVVVADTAGNTSSATVSATLNTDLDGDGIANNVDGNSTVVPAVSKASIACTVGSPTEPCRFSDKQLGGQTSGQVTIRPIGMSFKFTDATGTTTKGGSTVQAGLTLVVTGGVGGSKVSLTIDGSPGTQRYPNGSYVVTDPAGSITIETVVGGPAEIEYTLNGAPVVITIAAGAVATLTETTTAGGVLTDVGLTPLVGTVTLNGQPLPVGQSLFLGTLTGTLSVSRGGFSYAGTFAPAASSNGLKPQVENVSLSVGSYVFLIPAGAFKGARDGTYRYEGNQGGVKLEIKLRPARGGKWTVEAEGKPVTGLTKASPVKLRIGDDTSI